MSRTRMMIARPTACAGPYPNRANANSRLASRAPAAPGRGTKSARRAAVTTAITCHGPSWISRNHIARPHSSSSSAQLPIENPTAACRLPGASPCRPPHFHLAGLQPPRQAVPATRPRPTSDRGSLRQTRCRSLPRPHAYEIAEGQEQEPQGGSLQDPARPCAAAGRGRRPSPARMKETRSWRSFRSSCRERPSPSPAGERNAVPLLQQTDLERLTPEMRSGGEVADGKGGQPVDAQGQVCDPDPRPAQQGPPASAENQHNETVERRQHHESTTRAIAPSARPTSASAHPAQRPEQGEWQGQPQSIAKEGRRPRPTNSADS